MKKRPSVKKSDKPSKTSPVPGKESSKKSKKDDFDPAYGSKADPDAADDLDTFGEKLEVEDTESFTMEIDDDKDA